MLEKQISDQTSALEELTEFFHNRCSLQAYTTLNEKYRAEVAQRDKLEKEVKTQTA